MEPPYPEPQFLPRLLNVTARQDGKAVLPCAVHYLGTKHVTWRRLGDNHFLSVGDLTWVKDPNIELQYNELTPEVTEWNLVIKKVTPEHIGTYECRISDRVQLVRFIELDVVGPPLVEPVTFPPIAISGMNYVEMGQPIHLFCNTTGPNGMHLSIDWFKDGDRIDHINYRHVVITNYNMLEPNVRVSELLIDRSRPSDTGTYICRSASGYIDSLKVTVLFADTTNVKRGNPGSQSTTSRPQCLRIVVIIIFLVTTQVHQLLTASWLTYL
ncbi:hypothetical protein BsWGS_01944 [Bradybaena similaris]